MIVPTKFFWALVALGIPIAFLGAAVPGLEKLVIPYNIIIFTTLIVSGVLARKWDILQIDRSADDILSVRVPNVVKLTVENQSSQPLRVIVRDEPPNGCVLTQHEYKMRLPALGKKSFSYTITPMRRGNDSFKGTYVRWLAPLGLAWVQKKFDTEAPAHIYPNVLAVREYELLKQRGQLSLMGVRRSRAKGLGQEFESLRDYNDDDFRTIDWKASARKNRLVVRNFEQEKNQGLIVCFDVGRHMLGEVQQVSKLDCSLDAGLMLMNAAEREGDQIGLLVFSNIVERWIAPKRGRAQVAALLDAIHDLHADPVQPDYDRAFAHMAAKWKRRSLVVVFTDVENELEATELARSLGVLNRRHLLMVVRVSDPRLRELKKQEISSDRALHHRAAALVCDQERLSAAEVLVANGIQTIEAEPQDLSAALVTAYLSVKKRSLI
jgi:uncharacterized protein (DUF58 family)